MTHLSFSDLDVSPSTLEFREDMTVLAAAQLEYAVENALKAMIAYGCDEGSLAIISMLKIEALRQSDTAFKRHESERAAEGKESMA